MIDARPSTAQDSVPSQSPAASGRRQETVLVSVVIPVHGDAAAELAPQLAALGRQDLDRPWELVIADNGVTPATLAAIERARPTLPRLRVLDVRERPGKAFAANRAAAAAAGRYLVLLDADDEAAPDYLRRVAAALDEHAFVGGRLDSARLNPEWLRARRAPMQETRLETLLGHDRPVVIGAAMAMHREAYLTVGGLDEQLRTQTDVDLSWRLHDAGYRAAFVPGAVVAYRYRGDVRGVWRQEVAYGRGEARLYAKHRALGLPARPLRRTVRGWLDVLLAIPGVRSQGGRARLATVAGAAAGRVRGSLEYRTFYL